MNKKATREIILGKINMLSKSQIIVKSNTIKNYLFSLNFFDAKKVFVYKSLKSEVSTVDIISKLYSNNCKVLLPKIVGDDMLAVETMQTDALNVSSFGFIEPTVFVENLPVPQIDIAIIPLVGFDKTLARLGRGKGHYDKFLENKDIIKIALAFSVQECESVFAEPHDVKMDYIITEEGIIKGCNNAGN